MRREPAETPLLVDVEEEYLVLLCVELDVVEEVEEENMDDEE